jgi:hypothetical protein
MKEGRKAPASRLADANGEIVRLSHYARRRRRGRVMRHRHKALPKVSPSKHDELVLAALGD